MFLDYGLCWKLRLSEWEVCVWWYVSCVYGVASRKCVREYQSLLSFTFSLVSLITMRLDCDVHSNTTTRLWRKLEHQTGTNTPCKGTPDCAQGFKCVNKFCQIVKLFKSCKSAVRDCGNMQTCSRKTCISSPNQSTCKKTSNCGVSQLCNRDKFCVNIPVGSSCSSSSTCGLGEQCVHKQCVSKLAPPTPCPKRAAPENGRVKCTSKRCTLCSSVEFE